MPRRVAAVGFVLALVGVLLVASPFVHFGHVGETPYYVTDVDTVADAPADTVDYEALPPAAQESFRAAALYEDSTTPLWSDSDADALAALRDHDAVRYEGEVYTYSLAHGDGSQDGTARALSIAAGSFLFAVGALIARTERLRPLDPKRAVVPALAVALSLGGLTAYEVVWGAKESFRITFGPALPASLLFLVVGASLRQRNWRWALGALAVAESIALSGALRVGLDGATALLVIAPIIGLPWLILGLVLTPPRPTERAEPSASG